VTSDRSFRRTLKLDETPMRELLTVVQVMFLAACASHQVQVERLPSAQSLATNGLHMHEADALAPASVRANGVDLHYVERGNGTPVLLVHGSLADYTYWAYSRRYNYPNRNRRDTDHSAMVEANDLAGFLDQLGPEPVHLVGHSYGAYTALVYAMENPQRVRSLVLAEPPIISWLPDIPGGEGIYEDFIENVWKPLAQAFTEGGADAGLDFTARWYFGVPWQEVTPEWQTLFSRNAEEWHALAVSAHAFPKLAEQRVRALTVPTLLLSGGGERPRIQQPGGRAPAVVTAERRAGGHPRSLARDVPR
jgi:non-heme chloroperoxidase